MQISAATCSLLENAYTPFHLHNSVNQDTQLSRVNSVKYLGIHLTTDMSWATHITNISGKTRKLIGLMYCQFHLHKPETALVLYKTFIQPHMEYASIMWNPHQCVDIQML